MFLLSVQHRFGLISPRNIEKKPAEPFSIVHWKRGNYCIRPNCVASSRLISFTMATVPQPNNSIKTLKVFMLTNWIRCAIDNVGDQQSIRFVSIVFSTPLVIQHLILDGRTTDAIEKTRELFPTLLNDTQLLFVLKVRQFIEMVNGTESEIRRKSLSLPSNASQPTTTTHPNHHSNHSTTPKNAPSYATSSERSSSPNTRTSRTSRSRSNSPYTAGRTSQHTNGTNNPSTTINATPRRSSTNEAAAAESSTNNPIVNLMDIDDNHSNATNGYNHHGTVASDSSVANGHSLLDDDRTDLVSEHNSSTNGYSKKPADLLDGMDDDGFHDGTHQMAITASYAPNVQKKAT